MRKRRNSLRYVPFLQKVVGLEFMYITPGKFVRRNTVLAILVCFFGVVFYSQAFGQNIERYRPLELTPPSVQIPEIDREKLDAVTGDDKVLVEQLEAVIVIDHQDKVSKETEIDDLLGVHHKFEATDSLVYGAGVQQIIGRYLGQPITLRNLNQMARDIILHYRDCKQPIVDVAIPEQRITGGTVHVVVTETRIDRIVVQPGGYFDCCELSRWIRCTQTGDRIYEPKLESDLFWLNQNPFRKVTLDFQPGANSGTTDVIFKSCDVRPLRGYIGL
ncbi:MAG: hypothetical protein KDA87_22980, partial [Planctomycetales bacterium]|nr:hypothetical protein [Planctomycetales bacterium]